jgi:hypothetical protein
MIETFLCCIIFIMLVAWFLSAQDARYRHYWRGYWDGQRKAQEAHNIRLPRRDAKGRFTA